MYAFINSFDFGLVKPGATGKAKKVDCDVMTNVYGTCIGLVIYSYDIWEKNEVCWRTNTKKLESDCQTQTLISIDAKSPRPI